MKTFYKLHEAAKIAKVQPRTLRQWLIEAGMQMSDSRVKYVSERQLEQVLEMRCVRLARI